MPSATDHLRCWAEVDLDALRSNWRALRALIGSRRAMIPAVKADAYGHGSLLVARALSGLPGLHAFGVANVHEAVALRDGKVSEPVLLLSACLEGEVSEVVARGFIPVLSSEQDAAWFERALSKQRRRRQARFPVHVKVDTGMGRLGAWWEEAEPLIARVARSEWLELAAVMTHFSCSDSDLRFTRMQWRRFAKVLTPGFADVFHHSANSGGILRCPESHGSAVRPGIALYGYPPVPAPGFRPVLRWLARTTLVKSIGVGRTLSYGATFRAPRPMRVATVAAGYADGFRRNLATKAHVLIRGEACPVLGRVTMDEILVDVTRLPGVGSGEICTLLGPGVDADQLARWSGTISYEILTSIGMRVPRIPV